MGHLVGRDHDHGLASLFAGQDGGRGDQQSVPDGFGDDRGVSACTGFRRRSGFGSSIQTCTVAELGSVAGLTTVTFPWYSGPPSLSVTVAGCPTLICVASSTGIFTRATTFEISMMTMSGVPAAAMSPG